jgi:hypothetical protein
VRDGGCEAADASRVRMSTCYENVRCLDSVGAVDARGLSALAVCMSGLESLNASAVEDNGYGVWGSYFGLACSLCCILAFLCF